MLEEIRKLRRQAEEVLRGNLAGGEGKRWSDYLQQKLLYFQGQKQPVVLVWVVVLVVLVGKSGAWGAESWGILLLILTAGVWVGVSYYWYLLERELKQVVVLSEAVFERSEGGKDKPWWVVGQKIFEDLLELVQEKLQPPKRKLLK